MRILMVTPYAPLRDGIAAYAIQTVRRLRREGHDVEVLSPTPSAAHHHLELASWRGSLALARRVRSYDLVILQFHPEFFFAGRHRPARIVLSTGLARVMRHSRRSEVIIHEVDYARLSRATERWAFRRFIGRASRVVVHTEPEREHLAAALGVPEQRIDVRRHESDFEIRTAHDRASARASLELPAEARIFLCIGFIQPHKGFDRALRAFSQLGDPGARLYVVGSLRVDEPSFAAHLAELRLLAETIPGASMVEGYLTDELFDRWIVASDVVVLPYREIWSSGVLARAMTIGREAIVADVGGLSGQRSTGTRLFRTDEDLVAAMRAAAAGPSGSGRRGSNGDAVAAHLPPKESEPCLPAVTRRIAERAAAIRLGLGVPDAARGGQTEPRAHDRLAAIAPLSPPVPVSRSRLRRTLKLLVQRSTRWEVDPVVAQLNALHAATLEAVAALDASLRREVATVVEDVAFVTESINELTRAIAPTAGVSGIAERFAELRERVNAVERRTRRAAPTTGMPANGRAPELESPPSSFDYVGFERRFRGDPQRLGAVYRERYLPMLRGHGPVLDIGCGKGELLLGLRDAGVEAMGVDLDPDMAAQARAQGLDARCGDALAMLTSLPERSLGAITCIQVIEHVPFNYTVALLEAAASRLRPGGLFIAETPNPTSLVVNTTFILDPTHLRPMHPDLMVFLLESAGFRKVETMFLAPATAYQVDLIAGTDLPPWVEDVNCGFAHLNKWLFGPQDYAVIAATPPRSPSEPDSADGS